MNDYDDEPKDPLDDDRGSQWFEEARRRVQTPGSILFVFGLISVFLAVVSLSINLFSPDAFYKPIYEWVEDMQRKGQQQNPQANAQQLPPYEDWKRQQTLQGLPGGILSFICSFFIVIGASKMKQLRGYGLAMTGSIMAMIPCTNSCCCISVPFGIWALVVLLNADVKLAFARTAAGAPME